MPFAPLACTVRGCEAPLRIDSRRVVCTRGHSFDIARSGYINLLQPQDRKSPQAGDTRAAVEARAELIAGGIGLGLNRVVIDRASSLPFAPDLPVVIDLGCGAGDTLGRLARSRAIIGVGIDLSTAAASLAARRFPTLTWVVSNADRRLPLLDDSVDLALSVHGRRHASECRRVLKTSGWLILAIPAEDDLIELREAVQGGPVRRDRVEAVVAEHERDFDPIDRSTVREVLDLDRPHLLNLLRGTYRGERLSASSRVRQLDHLRVTLASHVVVLRSRQR